MAQIYLSPYAEAAKRTREAHRRALGLPETTPTALAAERYAEILGEGELARSRQSEQQTQENWEKQFGLNQQISQANIATQQQELAYEGERITLAQQQAREQRRTLEAQGNAQKTYALAQMGGGWFGGTAPAPAPAPTPMGPHSQAQATTGVPTTTSPTTTTTPPTPFESGLQNVTNTIGKGLQTAAVVTGRPEAALLGLGIQAIPTAVKGVKAVYNVVSSMFTGKPLGPADYSQSYSGIGTVPDAAPFPEYPFDFSGLGDFGLSAGPATSGAGPGSTGAPVSSEGSAASAGDWGGTVICTELHRQGILDSETYAADSAFGKTLSDEVLTGYHVWGEPLARAMSKSKSLTKVVWIFARPWATEMAYQAGIRTKGHLAGRLIMKVGIPMCRIIGKTVNYIKSFAPVYRLA
jgi:hypothetical protein